MKQVLVGLAFGVAWAAMQYSRGAITDLGALVGPVLLFGLFGAVLWGVRALVLWWRRRP